MKPKYRVLIGIGVVLLLAILTNPGKEKHKEALQKVMLSQMEIPVAPDESTSEWEQAGQTMGLVLGQAMANQLLEQALSVDNYFLFSTAKARMNGEDSRVLTIGVFGMVHFLDEKNAEEHKNVELKEESSATAEDEEGVSDERYPQIEEAVVTGFEGCTSVHMADAIGHWVVEAQECEGEGGLWIESDGSSFSLGGWEWHAAIVGSRQESDRTTLQLRIVSEGEESQMEAQLGMKHGRLVLDPVLLNYCCGYRKSELVHCPSEVEQ